MIEEALAAILDGQIVGMPTDTVYGVGVDPFNLDAVESLFELKGRPEHKPVGVLVDRSSTGDRGNPRSGRRARRAALAGCPHSHSHPEGRPVRLGR